MNFEPVHIHSNRLNKNFNVFLLFIPIILFALILAVLLSGRQKQQVATTQESPSVLGEEVEGLDNGESFHENISR